MTGGTLDAATAYSYGMLNAVAGPDEFPAVVRQLAERLANGAATALSLIKRSFELSQAASLEQALGYEAQAQQVAGLSHEYAEGVQAFREKRQPKFR
jgi:2-(1,2-epoxy-1,2-dihydrophenyl)acetyl-CoA isomerase